MGVESLFGPRSAATKVSLPRTEHTGNFRTSIPAKWQLMSINSDSVLRTTTTCMARGFTLGTMGVATRASA